MNNPIQKTILYAILCMHSTICMSSMRYKKFNRTDSSESLEDVGNIKSKSQLLKEYCKELHACKLPADQAKYNDIKQAIEKIVPNTQFPLNNRLLTIHFEQEAHKKPRLTKTDLATDNDDQAQGNESFALVHIAAMKNDVDLIRFACNHGADINLQSQRTYTTTTTSNIRNQSKLHTRSNYPHDTPLHIAIANNNQDAARELIHQGANLYIANNNNETARSYARSNSAINNLIQARPSYQYIRDRINAFLKFKRS